MLFIFPFIGSPRAQASTPTASLNCAAVQPFVCIECEWPSHPPKSLCQRVDGAQCRSSRADALALGIRHGEHERVGGNVAQVLGGSELAVR